MPSSPASPHAGTLLGIEIGGTKLQIAASQVRGVIERRWRAKADRNGGAAIRQQLLTGLRELSNEASVRAIGVGFGGPIDVVAGRTCRSHQVQGWDDFPLRDWLVEQLHVPVAVENDSNAAALGEAIYGAGAGLSPVFYANFGSGVGGGIVVEGQVYHGRSPGEAEFGHLLLDREGATVESRCAGWAVDRKLRDAAHRSPQSVLARLIGGSSHGEARYLAAAIEAGDAAASSVLGDLAADIALALSHVSHLLNPRVLVLGGGLSLVGERLRSAVAAALPALVMKAFHPVADVRLARLAEDAVPIGALELAARLA